MRNPTILITGASSGIGHKLALSLAKLNYKVIATVRKAKDAEVLKNESNNLVMPLQMDVTNAHQIKEAFINVREICGDSGLFALINNAGIVTSGPLEFIPIADVQTQLETNVLGVIRVTKVALPLLRMAQGRIINISSPSGRVTLPFIAPYSLSKAALNMLTRGLRLELNPWRIQATSVELGDVATPIWEKFQKAKLNCKKIPSNNYMKGTTLVSLIMPIAFHYVPQKRQ